MDPAPKTEESVLVPTFNCTYTKSKKNKNQNTYSGRITLDSGACLSVVHELFLLQCDFKFTGERVKEYSGAGGSRLPLLDKVADVKIYVDKLGWVIFRNVLVLKKDAKLQPVMLIGRYDLQRRRNFQRRQHQQIHSNDQKTGGSNSKGESSEFQSNQSRLE